MSLFLVALIPGLLMVATVGLGRLEARLADPNTVTAGDVDAAVERARADCARTPVRRVRPVAPAPRARSHPVLPVLPPGGAFTRRAAHPSAAVQSPV